MNKLALIPIALSLFLLNCAGTGGMKKSFSEKKSSLGYLSEKQKDLSESVEIGDYTFKGNLIADNQVKRTKSVVVPLLIINTWDHKFDINLGQSGLEGPESLEQFARNSLRRDLEESGATISNEAQVNIKVNVTEISSYSQYYKNGMFYFFLLFYGYNYHAGARNIHSKLSAEYTITRNGESEEYNFQIVEGAEIPKVTKKDDFNQMLVNGMVETLSICFKKLNGDIISKIE